MGHPEHPTMIQLEASTTCDGKCLFCYRPRMRRQGGTMKRWVFEKILEEARELGIYEILLFLYGEPFLFGSLFEWLQRLRDYRCTTVLFTNAVYLTGEKAEQLLSFHDVVRIIVFSVPGINHETYHRIVGLDYGRAMENISRFLAINANEIKINRISTSAHIARMSHSEAFIEHWVAMWQGKVDNVCVTPMFNYCGLLHDDLELKENEEHQRFYCDRLNHINILWDGCVSLCCWDAEGAKILGDVKRQTLKEIFYGSQARHYRWLHKQGDYGAISLCEGCNANILHVSAIEEAKAKRAIA